MVNATGWLIADKPLLGTDRRCSLLQTGKDEDHLFLLFDVLHLLNDVEVRGAGTTDVHCDRLDESAACKVLNLLGHCG